jgi:hypothetical protein
VLTETLVQPVMSAPALLQSFLGGIALALPTHDLLTLNGSVFGISGFLHQTIRGSTEAALAVCGLLLGGMTIGLMGSGNTPQIVDPRVSSLIASGLLVGVGTKVCSMCCWLVNTNIFPTAWKWLHLRSYGRRIISTFPTVRAVST